jgi:hypothetical protein
MGDFIVHVRPGLELKVPSDRVEVDFSGKLDWAQYLGIEGDHAVPRPGQPDLVENTSDLSRMYAEAGLGITVNRRGVVGLELDDEFRRSLSTSSLVFGTAVVSNLNALNLRLPYRPGGGALVLAATGGWTLETFEPFREGGGTLCDPAVTPSCDPDVLAELGYDELRAGAEARWKFLPRTQAVLEGGWFTRQPNDPALSAEVSGYGATVGMTGLVTPHVGATVKLGYGATSGAEKDAAGLLATAEAEWTPTQTATLRFGYARGHGVDPGTVLSVYTADRVSAGGRVLFGGRYAARLDAGWEHRAYEVAVGSASADVVTVSPSLEAALAKWMTATVAYAYTNRGSSFPAPIPAAPAYDYEKNEAWLKLAVRY